MKERRVETLSSKAIELKRNKALGIVVSLWILWIFISYYYFPFFVLPFTWLGSLVITGVAVILLIVELIREWKYRGNFQVLRVLVYTLVFVLTIFQFNFINRIVERFDWALFRGIRNNLVEQIQSGQIKPVKGVYQLPYEFPVISNGGNDLSIWQRNSGEVTIGFWVFRNFFSSPSTSFIYTNDPIEIERIEKLISNDPKNNWKLDDNWYRTFEE